MKGKIYILSVIGCWLSACQSDGPMTEDVADRSIYLSAQVESPSAESRTAYWLTEPTAENPLSVAVWASTDPTAFIHTNGANGTNGTVALHTTAKFTNGNAQLLKDAVYPKNIIGENASVYFVGMHPQDGWTGTGDGKMAIRTFNGREDVMFAPHISGSYGGNVQKDQWPTFTFHHLLTWLRIKMVAESEAIRDAWGKVTSLTVKSVNGVNIDLTQHQNDFSASCIHFTGSEVSMPFYQTDKDEVFPPSSGYTLKAPLYQGESTTPFIEEVAYVLCAPVDATEVDKEDNEPTTEYVLEIVTEKRKVNVNVDLKSASGQGTMECFGGSTMNCQFTILLNFKMGDNISVMATQTDWKTGGIGSEDFNESDLENN